VTKAKVFLGWPDGGSVHAEFAKSLVDLVRFEWAEEPSPEYDLLVPDHQTSLYVQENRNILVRTAKERGADWLLQVDADEAFAPTLLRQLMRTASPEARPIVCGVYANVGKLGIVGEGSFDVVDCLYHETETGEYVNVVPPSDVRPFRVDACGTGVLLTHLSVFDRVPEPWFWVEQIQPTGKDRPQIMNEDLAFCRAARESGYEIWCDPLAEAMHYKTVPLTPSALRRFLERARAVEAEMGKVI
jgi:hypothetical protein